MMNKTRTITITIPKTRTITVPKTMTKTMTTHSDSSMFDGREADDRWDNPKQAAVYWGEGLGRHAAEGSDAIFSVRIPYTTSISRYIWRRER